MIIWVNQATFPFIRVINIRLLIEPAGASGSLKQLSQLSTYIAASEQEIGYSVDFTKPYIEIRSQYLLKSLHPLSQAVQASERHQGSSSYEKGSSELLRYMECVARMLQAEQEFAAKILSNATQRAAALRGSIVPAMNEFVTAGRQVNALAKRLGFYDAVFVLDILEKYERDCAHIMQQLSKDMDVNECTDMIGAFKTTTLRNFYEFMEDIKGKKENNAFMNLSNDGTVHETTSNVRHTHPLAT